MGAKYKAAAPSAFLQRSEPRGCAAVRCSVRVVKYWTVKGCLALVAAGLAKSGYSVQGSNTEHRAQRTGTSMGVLCFKGALSLHHQPTWRAGGRGTALGVNRRAVPH